MTLASIIPCLAVWLIQGLLDVARPLQAAAPWKGRHDTRERAGECNTEEVADDSCLPQVENAWAELGLIFTGLIQCEDAKQCLITQVGLHAGDKCFYAYRVGPWK